ncbi:MAG: flagellar biosynthesis anti-sigma factor FlgM, partial [Porticoccaceae bacterium]
PEEKHMTDPISQLGRASVQVNPNADQVKNKKAEAAEANAVAPKPQQDEVVLSEAAEMALADADFDSEKVARIKQAIEEGNYPLDAKRIAESFVSLEKMIGGK